MLLPGALAGHLSARPQPNDPGRKVGGGDDLTGKSTLAYMMVSSASAAVVPFSIGTAAERATAGGSICAR